jgi:uncharacterized protein YndB with AHSA1/START domain
MAVKITVSVMVDKPVEKVWNCFTKPEHITKWNFASEEWHCPKAENDVRIDGKYFARMEAKDGSFGFDFITIYNNVIIQKELSYTMEDGRKATTIFENIDGKTIVTTTFDAEHENPIELQQGGWQSILNNFKAYSEKNNNINS